MTSGRSTGYLELLKSQPSFRSLWYGQVISELGDWLNSIAIYTLILQLSGSGMAMAAAMMAKLLPIFFVSPFAGVLIDRTSRKWVMIVSDVLRFFIVLGFLLVEDKGDLWLVYTLVVLEISMAGFFEPARSAIIPSLIPRDRLVAANALSGSTWSVMVAFGSALGGVVVSLLGVQAAFLLDAVTFLLSAWFICKIPESLEKPAKITGAADRGGYRSLVEGARYLYSRPTVLVLALLKSGLALSGGVMTLIPLYASQILSQPAKIAMGIGILYSSRGVGAALGPILVRRYFGDSSQVLRNAILAGFFLGTASYLLLSQSGSLWTASLSLGLATLFGSIVWVFSSALIHLEADDRFLGRIFSAEMASLTLVMGISNWAVGYAIDGLHLSLDETVRWMAGFFVIPGVLWGGFLLFVHPRLKEAERVETVCPVDPTGFNPVASTPPLSKD